MTLTEKQLKNLKEKLLTEKNDLEEQLKELNESLDFGSDIDHFEEEADETEEFSNRLGTKLILEKRLEKIEKALNKIKTKKYGYCEKCSEPISETLLETDPETELCQNCKKQK